jgi:hypothetical protein
MDMVVCLNASKSKIKFMPMAIPDKSNKTSSFFIFLMGSFLPVIRKYPPSRKAASTDLYKASSPEVTGILLENNVPLMHVAAVDDEIVAFEENTLLMEKRVAELGSTLKVFRHPGGHHPHGLEDPTPVADYVEAHMR